MENLGLQFIRIVAKLDQLATPNLLAEVL